MSVIIDKLCVKCNKGYMELWTDRIMNTRDKNVIQYSWFECNNCHDRDYIFSNDPFASEEMTGGETSE